MPNTIHPLGHWCDPSHCAFVDVQEDHVPFERKK